MKLTIRTIIPLLGCIIMLQSAFAQDTTKIAVKVDPSLKGQYEEILSRSKTLNGFKLVNPSRLSAFWKNLRDTLSSERKQLAPLKTKITDQNKTITALKTQLTGSQNLIDVSNARLNEISFLGISFTKSTYNTMVWTLIILLAIALAIVVIRSAKSIQEAKYRSTLYEEISSEYQSYKVKANEKEKKLARELQDERNKLEELKGK
jgi:uncharacterized protein YlxW (UPF0749 family)